MSTIVVTRHTALIEYLIEQGVIEVDTDVVSHATIEDVSGMHVIGVLPLALAVHALSVTEVPLNIPMELRGQELTLEQVRLYAQPVQRYTVRYSDE